MECMQRCTASSTAPHSAVTAAAAARSSATHARRESRRSHALITHGTCASATCATTLPSAVRSCSGCNSRSLSRRVNRGSVVTFISSRIASGLRQNWSRIIMLRSRGTGSLWRGERDAPNQEPGPRGRRPPRRELRVSTWAARAALMRADAGLRVGRRSLRLGPRPRAEERAFRGRAGQCRIRHTALLQGRPPGQGTEHREKSNWSEPNLKWSG
jgi:hypothetical protein